MGHIASVLANMRLQRKQGSSRNNLKVQLLHTPAQSQVRLETFIANNGFLSSTFAQALICRALTGLSIVCSRLQDKKDAKNARGLGERDGGLSPILSRSLPRHRIPCVLFSLGLFHFREVPSIYRLDSQGFNKSILNFTLLFLITCVASVSVRFRSKERGTRVKDRAKNGASKRAGRGGEERKKTSLPLPPLSFFGSCFISRGAKTENPVPRSFFAPKPNRSKRLLRRLYFSGPSRSLGR